MESALAAIMALPVRCGGFGFPQPKMNYRYDLPAELVRFAGRQYVEFDLYFPDHNLVVEYDSKSYHANDERHESDSRRNNMLRHLGFTVVNITPGQVQDTVAFTGAMNQIGEVLDKSVDASASKLPKREALRHELFPFLAH